MSLFSMIGRSALFMLEAEQAHKVSIWGLKMGLVPVKRFSDSVLKQTICGIDFPNPLGLSAGYDKNAEVPLQTLNMGFGFTEVGTLTPRPQAGNEMPRLFRLIEDEAIINRMGFNNEGYQAAFLRLNRLKNEKAIIGVNIGANKDSEDRIADYVMGISKFYRLASYFTINISSPNTVGLRDLQFGEPLRHLLKAVLAERDTMIERNGVSRPIFLKIAPDLQEEQLDEIADAVLNSTIDGVIVSNTTVTRDHLKDAKYQDVAGGLSGAPLFERSTVVLAQMRLRLGVDVPLIASGGINSAATAMTKIKAGADLLQMYTGLVYGGPNLPNRILQGLAHLIRQEGAFQISKLRDQETELWASRKKM